MFGTALANAGIDPESDADANRSANRLITSAQQQPEAQSRSSLQSFTGSKASQTRSSSAAVARQAPGNTEGDSPRPHDALSGDEQLRHLRSLLLGNTQETQQDHLEVVSRRAQTGLNTLRRDMDNRVADLSEYIERVEQTMLSRLDAHPDPADLQTTIDTTANLSSNQHTTRSALDDLERRVADESSRLDERLDALDARLAGLLDNMRGDLDRTGDARAAAQDERHAAQIAAQQDQVQAQITEANARTDRLLTELSDRLEKSIEQTRTNLTAELEQRSVEQLDRLHQDNAAELPTPEQLNRQISEQVEEQVEQKVEQKVEQRVQRLAERDNSPLSELREMLLSNMTALKAELREQTEEQSRQLRAHRDDIDARLNSALATLDDSKVSHRDLSQLLTRLADRVKQL